MTDPAPFLTRMPWPAGTPITQEFGDMFSGYPHRGRDAGCVVGTPIVAGAPGVIVPCTNDGSFGNAPCVDYGNGLFGLMAHNSELRCKVGDHVGAETVIALSGYSGYVQPAGPAGAHSHFQLCVNTQFPTDISYSRDPRLFLITEDTLAAADIARIERLERLLIANGFDAVCRPGTEALFPPGTAVVPEGQDGPRIRLTGENALKYADARQFSLGLAVEYKVDAPR